MNRKTFSIWRKTGPLYRLAYSVALALPLLTTAPVLSQSLSQEAAPVEATDRTETERNREIVQRAFEAWANGESVFDELLADDVVWTIHGSDPVAGTYNSKEDFVERASMPLVSRLETPVVPVVHAIWAEDDAVIVRFDGSATTTSGAPYRNEFVWIFWMEEDVVTRAEAFLDLAAYREVVNNNEPEPTLAQPVCPSEGPDSPAELHRTWILEGWDRTEGDPEFVFAEKLAKYYELDASGVYYDDLAPGQKTVYTPAAYGGMWEGPFNSMRSAKHGISDEVDAIVGDRVASTTLEFVARLEGRDGNISAIFDRSQLGWECLDEGRWVIRHEHNSSREATVEEIAGFLPAASE